MVKKNQEENKKKSNWIWIVLVVLILLLIGFWIGSSGDDSKTHGSSSDDSSNLDDGSGSSSNQEQEVEVVNEDAGIELVNVEFPDEVKLYEPFEIKYTVQFDDESIDNIVRVYLEELGTDMQELQAVSKKYSGEPTSKSFELKYDVKDDIGANKYKLSLVVDKKVIASKEFTINGLSEYNFDFSNVNTSLEYQMTAAYTYTDVIQGIKISNFDGYLDSALFYLKGDGEIIAKTGGQLSSDKIYRFYEDSLDENFDIRKKYYSPDMRYILDYNEITIDIYDSKTDLYVTKDIKVDIN